MACLRNLPLQRTLTLMVLGICATVLFLACAVLLGFELRDFRHALVRETLAMADMLAGNSQAALSFRDDDAARGILSALHVDQEVDAARLFDRTGTTFADYRRASYMGSLPSAPSDAAPQFTTGHVTVFRPVMLDGGHIGTLYVQVSLQGMHERIAIFASVIGLVAASALFIAFILSHRLQRLISRPILGLAETAKAIARHHDYSVRAPACDDGNEIGTLTSAFNGMLERIQNQNLALREGEERARATLNAALSAVLVMDEHGDIVDWNARAEAIFGWSRTEILGHRMVDTVFPVDQRERYQSIASLIGTGGEPTPGPVEMTAIRRDGRTFPAELSTSRLIVGGTVRSCAFITDITERHEAVQRIKTQLARLALMNRITKAIGERQDLPSICQAVVHSIEEDLPVDMGTVLLRDPTGRSLRATGISGHHDASAVLAPLDQPIPIDRSGLSECLFGRLLYDPEIGGSSSGLLRVLADAGYRSCVGAPLLVESQVFGVLVVARRQTRGFTTTECDFLQQLSEQVALAAHQAQLHGALQQAYDELRQTQQAVMQQERLRALGQMASGIAHDINNAISPVVVYTELLLEKEPTLSDRARKYLGTIARAIDDVAHTVARMREFYRHREEMAQLAPVDANQMVEQVVDLTRARWSDMPQRRGVVIDVETEFTPGIPPLRGVASEIREALTNLIFNAVDAMPKGGTLTLRTRQLPTVDREQRLCIEVTDTGVGMPDDIRRRCLEPFFTTKGERGTGLGLAMVYGIARRHNAEVEIDSTVGVGTTMRLVFAVSSNGSVADADDSEQRPSERLKILLVDDDPMLANSLRDALEADGHRVVTADHGRSGIDAFRTAIDAAAPFAVVITDLGMPYVDGRVVAASVKEMLPETPVILLTGWGDRLAAEGDVPEHVDCVLSKPPNMRSLRRALAQHVRSLPDSNR